MTVHELLKAALALIEKPENWTQDHDYATADNKPTGDLYAVRFSLFGALGYVAHKHNTEFGLIQSAYKAVHAASPFSANPMMTVSCFSYHPICAHSSTVATLRSAIASTAPKPKWFTVSYTTKTTLIATSLEDAVIEAKKIPPETLGAIGTFSAKEVL